MHSQQATRAPLTQGEGLAFNTDGCALGAHAVKNVRLAEGASYRFRDATIYFPAHEGSNLASVVMVGGWGCGVNSMAAWGPFYASHGIVAMTIGTPSPWRDWPKMRADALRDGVAALRAEHARPGSALHDRLDVTRFAVQGWSLGGGGAQLAVMADPSLKCAIALSPHSGLGLPPVLSTAVPVLFLVGQDDPSAPARKFAWEQYRQTHAPKVYLEVAGGDHAVANGPSGGLIREAITPCAPCALCKSCTGMHCGCSICGTFNGATGHARSQAPRGAIGAFALAWLQLFLQGHEDESLRTRLQIAPTISSGFECERMQRA